MSNEVKINLLDGAGSNFVSVDTSTGIQPFVTVFHNEFPQELEDRFGGWLSPLMQ